VYTHSRTNLNSDVFVQGLELGGYADRERVKLGARARMLYFCTLKQSDADAKVLFWVVSERTLTLYQDNFIG
jgi:hypothetical protein